MDKGKFRKKKILTKLPTPKGEYSVVKFLENASKLFACLPDNWFFDENKDSCFWPPKGKSVTLRAMNYEEPDPEVWEIFSCILVSGGHPTYSCGAAIVRDKASQKYNTSSADEHLALSAFRRKHPGLVSDEPKSFEKLFENADAAKNKIKEIELQNEQTSDQSVVPSGKDNVQTVKKLKSSSPSASAGTSMPKTASPAKLNSRSDRSPVNLTRSSSSAASIRSCSRSSYRRSRSRSRSSYRRSRSRSSYRRSSSRSSHRRSRSRSNLSKKSKRSSRLGSESESQKSRSGSRRSCSASESSHSESRKSRSGSRKSHSASSRPRSRSRSSRSKSQSSQSGSQTSRSKSRSSHSGKESSTRRRSTSSSRYQMSRSSSKSSCESIPRSNSRSTIQPRSRSDLRSSTRQTASDSLNQTRNEDWRSKFYSDMRMKFQETLAAKRDKQHRNTNSYERRLNEIPSRSELNVSSNDCTQRDLINVINGVKKSVDENNRRLAENDRRLDRMEVVINKVFILVSDATRFNAPLDLTEVDANTNPHQFEVPKIPVLSIRELTVLNRKLKSRRFSSFLVNHQKEFCAPSTTTTDTVVYTAYLQKFISLSVRSSITLKEAKGKNGLTLFTDFRYVYLYLIDVVKAGYQLSKKTITTDQCHVALRIVWGRSNQLLKNQDKRRHRKVSHHKKQRRNNDNRHEKSSRKRK